MIKEGDVFQLGTHRLMCGDSLNWGHVQKLLNGHKAQMLFTDPPYGINYVPEDRPIGGRARSKNKLGGIKGDIKEAFDYQKFLELINTKIIKGAVYICAATNNYNELWDWNLKTFNREPVVIVWAKNNYSIGRRHYHRKHEFIFYNYFEENKWLGGYNQNDVWYVPRRDPNKYIHPTQKPLLLIRKAIKNNTEPKDIVLDLFGGSGSTLIACEQTNRICYMMELDPNYIKIIIKRWEALTSQKAVKVS